MEGIGSSLNDMPVLGWLNSLTFTAMLSRLLSNVVDSDTVVVESSVRNKECYVGVFFALSINIDFIHFSLSAKIHH